MLRNSHVFVALGCVLSVMPRGSQRRARQRNQGHQGHQGQQKAQGLPAPASTVALPCTVDASNNLVLCEQACRDILACNAEFLEQARSNAKTLMCLQKTMALHDKARDPRRRVMNSDAKNEYRQVYSETLRAFAYVFEVCLLSFPRGTPDEKRGMAVAVAVDGLDRLGCSTPSGLDLCPNQARFALQEDMWAFLRGFYMDYSGIDVPE